MSGNQARLLVLSGAYCHQELVSEFGRLPPAFLPVGGRRLFELQRAAFPGMPATITLPASFRPDATDLARLSTLDLQVLPSDDRWSLGQALDHALAEAGRGPCHILYGDTLVNGPPPHCQGRDILATARSDEDYPWHHVPRHLGAGRDKVLIGYFHVTDPPLLRRALAGCGHEFLEAVYLYHQERPWILASMPEWRDFGHVHTYFRSKATVSTARAFNEVVSTQRVIRKSSGQAHKIAAEIAWYRALPPDLSPYVVAFAGASDDADRPGYATEFQYLNTLADLFVFGDLRRETWSTILGSCAEFLEACGRHGAGGTLDTGDLYLPKTLRRLEEFARASGFDIQAPCRFDGQPMPSLVALAEAMAARVAGEPAATGFVHGDLCFSNIFYDFRSRCIKLIDPRGLDGQGTITPFGDQRYDIAKLHHSVVGGYDFIIAGRCRAVRDGQDFTLELPFGRHADLQREFGRWTAGGVRFGRADIHAICVLLYLSMLPLHADRPDRQWAFVANALRLARHEPA